MNLLDIPDIGFTETRVNGKRVYVREDNGRQYPSVTTVTALHSEDAIRAWRARVGEEKANQVSKKASGAGNRVHGAIEKLLKE